MTGRRPTPYRNSKFIYHIINVSSYWCYLFLKIFIKSKPSKTNSISPVLITGLFRSGTTITSRIVKDIGFSAGPADHLLQAKGTRKALNPDGFLENHFFMELSLYLFKKTNSSGDEPPLKKEIEKVELKTEDDNAMVYFSLVKVHDDRISNLNKLCVQLKGSASNPEGYLNTYFNSPSFIKNPHFAVQFPYFKKIFPLSMVLVVFRNPFDAVDSAKSVTPYADYDLYVKYHEELCAEFKNGNKNIFFFSYDNLICETEFSLQKLMEKLGRKQVPEVPNYIHKKPIEGMLKKEGITQATLNCFNFMMNNCINKY